MISKTSKTLSVRKPRDRKPPKPVRVMVFGTFDVLHPGHVHLFRQARAKALSGKAFLIVSVARDKNVKRIKGRKPLYGERKRLAALQRQKLVDQAMLGALGDHIPHIVKHKPDIIALGYDQKNYVKGLRSALKQQGLRVKIVRLKPYKPDQYKSSLVKAKIWSGF